MNDKPFSCKKGQTPNVVGVSLTGMSGNKKTYQKDLVCFFLGNP